MSDRDRVANWKIGLGGDDSDLAAFLTSVKGKFQAAVNDLQRISNQAELFVGLQDGVKSASDALIKAQQDVKTFAAALAAAKDAGKDVTADLQIKLVAAQQAVKGATSEFNKAVDAVTKYENSLTRAGIDTANMATEQTRLAAALAATAAAAKLAEAQQTLGLVTTKSIQPEIAKLNLAYQALQASYKTGAISSGELAQASLLVKQRTTELEASVTNLPGVFEQMGQKGASAFDAIGGKALLAVAGIATVGAAIKTVVEANVDFTQGVTKVAAASNLTDQQLRTLGEGARNLSRTLGIDLNGALAALYEIIKSTNLGPEDSLTVLTESAKAAKASFTDLGVVAKVSSDLISGFGLSAKDLRGALDAIFASSKAGGPSFEQLAGGIGSLSVVAKSAGLSVSDMSGLLNVMASASGDGAGAVSELQKIILKFSTESVRTQLRAMGITSTDLVTVLRQLADQGADLNVLLDLGAATTKSAVGVTALTRSAADLDAGLARAAEHSGEVKAGLDKIANTPKEPIDKLAASFHNLLIQGGEGAGIFSNFVEFLTYVIDKTSDGAAALGKLAKGAGEVRSEVEQFRDSEAKGFAVTLTEDAKVASDAVKKLTADIAKARVEMDGIAAALVGDLSALNAAAAQQIATVSKAADEQIAALDRSAAAATKTAQQTVDIQTKASADILKIIVDNAKEVARVTDEAIAAKEASLRKTNLSEQQIYAELAKVRLAAIEPTIAAYQKFYDTLIAQSQAYAAKLRTIEDGRLAYQQSIDAKIFELRLGAVDAYGNKLASVYDQDVARAREADRLISLSREAALRGDVTLAQKYADQAIAQGDKLVAAYDEDGKLIIGQDQVQQKQQQLLLAGAESVAIAYSKQAEAAKAGLTSTNEALATVKGQLDAILKVQQDAQAIAKEGLEYKIRIDENSYDKVKTDLDKLTADRTVSVTVKMEGDPGFVNYTPVETRASGGPVGQAFASGGDVFRKPSWAKVPGIGNSDTIPARLNAGSFVVRKAASQFYGDGIMSALAGGYAGGGSVGPPDLESLRQSLEDAHRQLHDLIQSSVILLNPLIDGARTLPRSQVGENYSDALQIIRDLITSSTNAADVSALIGPIQQAAPGIAAAIDDAHKFHVPLVFGLSASGEKGGTFDQSAPSGLYQQLVKALNAKRFAGGGPAGGDTVPAWLTPGEWVINRPAAMALGGDVLHAINNMTLPRDLVQNIALPRPRYMETGGEVYGPGAPKISSGGGSRSAMPPIQIYVQRLTEEELERTVKPWFNRLQRASR